MVYKFYIIEGKDIESYPLAKLVMEELLKGTDAKDRGIIERPRLGAKQNIYANNINRSRFLSNQQMKIDYR